MRTLPVIPPTAPQLDDDQIVPEELVGRLYRASKNALDDLLSGLSLGDRVNLAMYCYRKSHLRRTGLAIAATWPGRPGLLPPLPPRASMRRMIFSSTT